MNEQLFRGRAVEEFASAYATVIEPKIGELARERRKYRLIWLAAAIALIAFGAWTGMALAEAFDLPLLFWVPVLIALHGAWVVGRWPRARYAGKIRAIIMEPITRFIGGIRYSHLPTTPFDIAPFRELDLLPAADRAFHEDVVEGRHRDTDFRMAELRLSSRRRTGKGSRMRTVFHGLIFDVAVPREFAGRVVLAPAPGRLTRALVDWSRGRRGLTPVEFDDPEFAALFRVHADDGAAARSLLEGPTRANLAALARALGKGGLMGAFVGGRFLIALGTGRRLIDIGSLLRLTGSIEDDVRRSLRDVTLAHRLIDVLHGDRPEAV